LPRIFGGGDCVTGPSSLIAALAAGKRAAAHIAHHLNGTAQGPSAREKLEHMLMQMNMLDEEKTPLEDPTPLMPIHAIPVRERLQSFAEVETDPLEWEAVRESSRCLRCLRLVMAAT
jgi:formate dehydrogenase beta subunit